LLNSVRPIETSFGVGLVLSPVPSQRAIAELTVRITSAGQASQCSDPGLEALRRGNPAARSLPLLAMLAAPLPGLVRLDLSHAALEVAVAPC
jgi:hypothetical protein